MAFYDNVLNKALDRLGVIRKTDLNNFLPTSALFAGETIPGAEWNIYARWSEMELQKLAVTNPWVYSSINIIGREIALGTMGVERRSTKDGEKWIAENNHAFERIVEGKPNQYMGQFFTWLYQMMWLFIQGEAYWMLVPNRMGELTELYPLPANRIVPVPDPSGERLYSYFAYSPITGAQPRKLLPEQVCFHRFPNLFDYHRGMSPISAYLMSLQLDTEARKFDLEDFRNGLTMKHLISMRPETAERDKLVAQADLEQGRKEGKRYMLIRAGQIDVKALENRRGDNGEVRRLTREECNYIFGIPDSVRDPQATEASAKVGREVFIGSTIWPLMCMLDEDMTAQIIHRFYEPDLRVKFEDVRPVNIELKLKEKEAKRKVQTWNEAAAEDGLGEHPDPDVGNAPYAIAGAVYLEKIRQQRVTLQQPDNEQGQPDNNLTGTLQEGKAAKALSDDVPQEIREYEAELIRLVEQAQNGELTRSQFEEAVGDATEAVLTAVFMLGSGLGELGEEERRVLEERIAADLASVPNLADDVFADKFKPMDEGGLGWSLPARVALWGTFALATYQMSKVFGSGEKYYRWDWSPEAQHCGDCEELNGQVRKASEWKAANLYPGNPALACRGFCRCRFTQVAQKAVFEPVINSNGHAH